MATVHGVAQQNSDGSPLLGAGQLVSTASLRELARQLGTGCLVEYLPDHVVARTPELLAWWTPATVRPMLFSQDRNLKVSPANGFSTRRRCSWCGTALACPRAFGEPEARVQTANWPQRPTGTSMATAPFVRERCAPRSH